MWITNGIITNPGVGTVLATTGPMPTDGAKSWPPSFWVSASVAARVQLQWIDSDGTTVLKSHVFHVSAGGPLLGDQGIDTLPMVANQIVRIINDTVVVGAVQASIFMTVN